MENNAYPCGRCPANINNDCTRVCLGYKLWFIPKWEETVKPFRDMLGKGETKGEREA